MSVVSPVLLSLAVKISNLFNFFFPGATTPIGGLFYSPLVGFSLFAYEVS